MSKKILCLLTLALMLGLVSSASAALEAHYQFEDGGGGTAMDMVGGHDGTLSSSVGWTTGAPSPGLNPAGGLSFPGASGDVNNIVNLGNWDHSGAGGEWSIAMWINWTGGGDYKETLITKRDGFNSSDMSFELLIKGSSIYVRSQSPYLQYYSASIDTGVWTHLAFVYNGSELSIYKNSTWFMTEVFGQGTGGTYPGTFYLGNNFDAHGESFAGDMDDVRIYSHALTAAEINALPEPATIALLGLGGLFLVRRKR